MTSHDTLIMQILFELHLHEHHETAFLFCNINYADYNFILKTSLITHKVLHDGLYIALYD